MWVKSMWNPCCWCTIPEIAWWLIWNLRFMILRLKMELWFVFSNFFFFFFGVGASYWFTDPGQCCHRRWRCWRIQDLHIHFKSGFQHWLLPAGWPLSQENNFALIRLAICTSAIQIRVLSSIMVHMSTTHLIINYYLKFFSSFLFFRLHWMSFFRSWYSST